MKYPKTNTKQTSTQKLLQKIASSQSIEDLQQWVKENQSSLLEREYSLMRDISIESQRTYNNSSNCYPTQFVVDRAHKVLKQMLD